MDTDYIMGGDAAEGAQFMMFPQMQVPYQTMRRLLLAKINYHRAIVECTEQQLQEQQDVEQGHYQNLPGPSVPLPYIKVEVQEEDEMPPAELPAMIQDEFEEEEEQYEDIYPNPPQATVHIIDVQNEQVQHIDDDYQYHQLANLPQIASTSNAPVKWQELDNCKVHQVSKKTLLSFKKKGSPSPGPSRMKMKGLFLRKVKSPSPGPSRMKMKGLFLNKVKKVKQEPPDFPDDQV